MKQKFKKILRRPFIQNVVIIASGTAGAQAIAMVLSPIITRLYGPEAFGIMGAFSAMTRIIVPIAALTYPIAIVLPKSDKEAKGLIRLSLIVTGIISFLSFIILVIFNKHIIDIFNLTEIKNFLFLIPLVVIFAGVMQVAEQWLIRTKQFAINARVTLYQSLITNLSKVGIGLFHPAAAVLVVLTSIANGIKAFLMILFTKRSRYRNDKHKVEKQSIKHMAKKYYDFPLYRAPEVFLNAVSNGVPVLMLTAFFGPASAGYYTIGRTVLIIPSQLIGKSVGDVFYPRIAEAANKKEDMTSLIKKATFALVGVGIIPFGLVVLFGPFLFSIVFGSNWEIAGEYARWLSLWAFFSYINRPSIRSLPVLNAQKFHLIYTGITLVMRLGGLSIGYYVYSSDLIAVAFFGVLSAILDIGLFIITLKISRAKSNNVS